MINSVIFEKNKIVDYILSLNGPAKKFNRIVVLKKISVFINAPNPTQQEILKVFCILQIYFQKKPKILSLRKRKILLKLRKGDFVGCLVTLRKNEIHDFLTIFSHILVFEDLENFQTLKNQKLIQKNLKTDNWKPFNNLNSYFSNMPKLKVFFKYNNQKGLKNEEAKLLSLWNL